MFQRIIFTLCLTFIVTINCADDNSTNYIRVKQGLAKNYTLKIGERLRLECEFDVSTNGELDKIYWIRNLEEIIQAKRGRVSVSQHNLSITLVIRKLDLLDKGSYSCYAENKYGNASSETMLDVIDTSIQFKSNRKTHLNSNKDTDYLTQLAGDGDDSADDFPLINPQIVESSDDKGFCEPYRGTICTNILTSNYSIYSMNANQQDQIEERLKSLLPLLTNKNSISKRCAAFALPSLCLFAFPLCDQNTQQPKQICRADCKQLQNDICKDEYSNVKSLFVNKYSNDIQQASNFLINCNQLPPSADMQNECLPIVAMTIEKNEYQKPVQKTLNNEKCIYNNGMTYRGSQSFTSSGSKCIKWDEQLTYMTTTLNFKYNPELNGHNYCRNIDNDIEPWCFTSERRKEYCGLPKCPIIDDLSDKKLTNLLYILIPAVCVPLVVLCLFLTFCYCRRANKTSLSTGSSTNHINSNTKLRMSMHGGGGSSVNGSTGHQTKSKAHINTKYGKNGSSKSSITSSNHNMESNPFIQQQQQLKQNDPYGYLQHNYQQVPLIQQQQQQQQYMATIQQQQANDYCMIKQYAANNIRLLQDIGKGNFGNIYIGELLGATSPTSVSKVIVKTLDENQHLNAEEEFYSELDLYSTLKHRNISNLIGIYAGDVATEFLFNDLPNAQQQSQLFPKCLIMEYMCNGNLHDYLQQRASANTNLSLSSGCSGMNTNNRTIADFLFIAQQTVDALDYLNSQNYVHKDIAARNILIGENLSIKLTDIAQYTEKYTKDYYKIQNKQLPVRWMSPESLLFGRYAADTDVWSYGVLIWEIFNYGMQPYSTCTNPEVIQMIRDRQLLLIPEDCPQRVYQLMLDCWHENSVQRPTFSDIYTRLKNWENYYALSAPIQAAPLTTNAFQMTNSYSSNSQNSGTNNHTASTGISTSSPTTQQPPMINCYSPPPIPTTSLFNTNIMKFKRPHSPPSSSITSCSSTRIYRELETQNSTTRNSQRQLLTNFQPSNGLTQTNLISNSNKNLIPNI